MKCGKIGSIAAPTTLLCQGWDTDVDDTMHQAKPSGVHDNGKVTRWNDVPVVPR